MSINTLKKKGIITCNGTKISGKPPGGYWVTQGPFGSKMDMTIGTGSGPEAGALGFSINGGTRNVGYIGKSSAFSKNGTPFYGVFPIGNGGSNGTYPKSESLMNLPQVRVITQGEQYKYIKPSVISTKGMLAKKYRWIRNGQYPNNWVQPVYGNSNLSDNSSQLLYIQQKAAANTCTNDTNKPDVYINNIKRCSSTNCHKTTALFPSYNIIASAGIYTKTLWIPQTASQYTLQVQRKCANPIGPQKPFPFATNNNSGGVGIDASLKPGNYSGRGQPSPISTEIYLTPPAWYTAT